MLEVTAAAIELRLRERFAPSVLRVLDESAAHAGHMEGGSGQGTHFRVRIACAAFVGRSRVQRHRLVYDAVDDFFAAGLHALALQTDLPQE